MVHQVQNPVFQVSQKTHSRATEATPSPMAALALRGLSLSNTEVLFRYHGKQPLKELSSVKLSYSLLKPSKPAMITLSYGRVAHIHYALCKEVLSFVCRESIAHQFYRVIQALLFWELIFPQPCKMLKPLQCFFFNISFIPSIAKLQAGREGKSEEDLAA